MKYRLYYDVMLDSDWLIHSSCRIIIYYWMALRGIHEYIARDVNNIARVEDEGNIVSIEGNIFLYPPKKSHQILLLGLFI